MSDGSWMVTVIAELQVPSSPRISRYCGNCSDGCVAVGDHFHSLGKLSEPESTDDSFSQSHNSSIPNGPRGATGPCPPTQWNRTPRRGGFENAVSVGQAWADRKST